MANRMSVATIDNPEFINLEPLDINPLMSKCDIKVLYIGENRNRSYITEDVARDMAKTLRGAPIVGWYNEDRQDFVDHGDRVTIDGDGIKFESLTKPYGFVAPDAQVWFQDFEDTDEFGNVTVRKYLMTTGYLWTGQYEEAKLALEEGGRPQSMELDEETLDGHWSEDTKSGIEFFIINDAIFSKLCILGEDVEPCFEGASITAPEVSASFTLDDDFKHTLYNMMKQLTFALQKEEGGQQMNDEKVLDPEVENVDPVAEEPVAENFSENQDNSNEEKTADFQNNIEGQEESQSDDTTDTSYTAPEESTEAAVEDEKYTALEAEYTKLQEEFTALQTEYQALVDFKTQVENDKKKALIDSFYMLSDEDKQDVIENMTKYSYDDIESKLCVICVKKKVNFNDNNASQDTQEQDIPMTYTLDNEAEDAVPAWINAVRKTKNNRK